MKVTNIYKHEKYILVLNLEVRWNRIRKKSWKVEKVSESKKSLTKVGKVTKKDFWEESPVKEDSRA